MVATARRAAPLPADERRVAILAATVPLLRELGTRVTTRQIATAAGVAEGTLFRVFPDKRSLIDAAVQSALSPAPLHAALAQVDPMLPLEERLLVIVGLLQRRLSGIIELMTMVGMHRPPAGGPAATGPGERPPRDAAHEEFLEMVAALLEPDRDTLTITPRQVARMLRLLTFAGTHPVISDGDPLTAAEIVAVVLNGVRRRGGTPRRKKALSDRKARPTEQPHSTGKTPPEQQAPPDQKAAPRKRNSSNNSSNGNAGSRSKET